MKYPTQSALDYHFLQSVLPEDIKLIEQKQFTKTKDFYHPQQFIWNNPHRTSQRMYKYYHSFNDKYYQQKQPLIKQMQQEDRNNQQQARIKRILQLRNNTRERFFHLKKSRQNLQAKTFASRKSATITNNSHSAFPHQNFDNFDLHTIDDSKFKSQRLMRIEKSYIDGLQKSQKKAQNMQKLICFQREVNHQRIREKFQNRKNTNSKIFQSILKKDPLKTNS